MGLKGDQGIRVQSMKAIAEAIEAYKPNGKVWVDNKKSYAMLKRRIIHLYGETFHYNKTAGKKWRGIESTRYNRYHIRNLCDF